MISGQDELARAIEKLESYQALSEEKLQEVEHLQDVVNEFAKSFCGSWLGYHSRVYYKNFQPPAPGANFSREWGMKQAYGEGTRGEWGEYAFDDVVSAIYETAGDPQLSEAEKYQEVGVKLFDEVKSEAEVVIRLFVKESSDKYGETLLEELLKVNRYSTHTFMQMMTPSAKFVCRDSLAISQGYMTPPHISVAAECFECREPNSAIGRLLPVLKKAYSYLSRSKKAVAKEALVGTNIFIGHGRSFVWRDLKDFLSERLRLPFDEFNRVPVAGITNIARLSEMLDSAAIAFIVMTAEDEQADGKMEARTNVIHEVGLFQGRLGFTRAIVLLEEGCQEFSNIQGLGQIRFPKGDIKAKFEEIRQVLEREKIIEY